MATRQMLIGTVFPGPFVNQTVSVDFAGGSGADDEYLRFNTDVDIGIGDVWSIVMVANRDQFGGTDALLSIGTSIANEIQLATTTTSREFRVLMRDSGNTIIKDHRWTDDFDRFVWTQIIVTWDGTDLKAYFNSTEVAADTLITDNAGSQTSTDRKISLPALNNGGQNFDGKVMYTAIFDYELVQADVDTLFNSGDVGQVDLVNALATGPLHWWRLGHDSSDIGKDYGNHSTLIDMMTDSNNITTDDIVSDFMGS